MNRNTMKIPIILFLLSTALLLLSHPTAKAQHSDKLSGKTLKRVEEATNVTSLLSQLSGDISTVSVVRDSEDRLTLDIDYSGFEAAYISITVKDKAQKTQRFVPERAFSLEGKTSPLEVELRLNESTPVYALRESVYLEIKVARSKGAFPKRFLYKLGKRWKKKIKPEKMHIKAVLSPVGSAAGLEGVGPSNYGLKATAPHPMDGSWVAAGTPARGIAKITISGGAKHIRIHKKCGDKDCSPGGQQLIPKGPKTCEVVFPDKEGSFRLVLQLDKNLKVREERPHKGGKKQQSATAVFVRQDPEPEGPGNHYISLMDMVEADHNFEFPHEISNVHMKIYPDKNPASGIFYYLPEAYHLRWDSGEGYQFKMLYGTAAETSSGKIRMVGSLTPGIGNTEVKLIKSLLQAYIQNNPGYAYKTLKIIPLRSDPEISLASGLNGQYNIPANEISVGVQSTITAPISVSWLADNRTKEEMQLALSKGVGIQGSMTLEPDSESLPKQLVPVRITLADTRTLGRFTLEPAIWRSKKWKNPTPYPIKLKFIHALVIKKENGKYKPVIYSWSLGAKEVPPGAGARFNSATMPAWLDAGNKAERIWIDYSIADCDSCVNRVMDALTGGTSGTRLKKISLESFRVFESLDAATLSVRIRSRQAGPGGSTREELPPVELRKDMDARQAGPFYLKEGEDLRYEYFFTLVMKNGTTYSSDGWKASREPKMFIGLQTLKDAISSIDAIPDD